MIYSRNRQSEGKYSLKPADLKACTYDQKSITLDGQIYWHISFGKRRICTTVYVKLVAPDQLLLSESVCCELGIVSYHPSVQSVLECHSAENLNRLLYSTIDHESDALLTNDKVSKLISDQISEVVSDKSF